MTEAPPICKTCRHYVLAYHIRIRPFQRMFCEYILAPDDDGRCDAFEARRVGEEVPHSNDE